MFSTLQIQTALKQAGFSPGPIDGSYGRQTRDAVERFQKHYGLLVDGVAGSQTLAALFPTRALAADGMLQAAPPWYAEALLLKGIRETAGAKSNPVILGWAKKLGGWVASFYSQDSIPWCGLFVSHPITLTLPAEVLPSNPLSALAWAEFGVPLKVPSLGAVCVFKRTGGGHVGFYAGEDRERGTILVLGGNQSDQVSIAPVARSRLVGFRWPRTAPHPSTGPIHVTSTAPVSRNEA